LGIEEKFEQWLRHTVHQAVEHVVGEEKKSLIPFEAKGSVQAAIQRHIDLRDISSLDHVRQTVEVHEIGLELLAEKAGIPDLLTKAEQRRTQRIADDARHRFENIARERKFHELNRERIPKLIYETMRNLRIIFEPHGPVVSGHKTACPNCQTRYCWQEWARVIWKNRDISIESEDELRAFLRRELTQLGVVWNVHCPSKKCGASKHFRIIE